MEEVIKGAAAQQRPRSGSSSASVADIMPHLAASFSLVRPVGMGDDAAEEWLAVAATELVGYPSHLIEIACSTARQTCTHHAQIVPAIIAGLKETTWNRKLPPREQPKRIAPPPEIQGLIDHAVRRIG